MASSLIARLSGHKTHEVHSICVKLAKVGYQPLATFMDLKPPSSYDHVEFPEKRRLKYMDKVPQLPPSQRPMKMAKDLFDMRGPELIQNKILYGEFGIQAVTGGKLRHGHFEMMRMTVVRKMDDSRMFAYYRVDQPWKSVTKKGTGHRMGGGKGSIDHYVYPVRAGRIILEIGGHCEFVEVERLLKHMAHLLPFKARIVTKQMLEEEAVQEEEMKNKNMNPFTFEYCAKNNFLGIKKWLSPYDYMWHGKHR